MAIAHRNTSNATFGVNGFTISVSGLGIEAGDMQVCVVAGKPYNAGISVSGWTQLETFTNGTTAAGVDTGSMFVTAWYKEATAAGGDSPSITEGSPAFNIVGGFVAIFSKGASETWATPVMDGGGDSSSGTGFSVTVGTDPGVTAGDAVIYWAGFPSDAATPLSTHLTYSQTGLTESDTHAPGTDPETTSGGDMGMCGGHSIASSGTGSAPGVVSGTLAAAGTGTAGIVRLRVTAAVDADAEVSWAELEVPTASSQAQISWAELEVPTASSQAQVSWAELEVPTASSQAEVSWAELEVTDPLVNANAEISWTEFEVLNANSDAEISWAEFEVPTASAQAEVAWAELEVPNASSQAEISWAVFEVSGADADAEITWAEFEVPTASSQAEISWVEFEVPTASSRADVAWAEFEVPTASSQAQIAWVDMQFPDLAGGGGDWLQDKHVIHHSR